MKLFTALRICYRAWFKRDELAQFQLAERATGALYPKYKFSEFGRLIVEDADFLAWYRTFEGDNFHSLDRKYNLRSLLRMVRDVPGDTAECGAYKGASSFLICQSIAGTSKRHFVFDSFEGLSAPNTVDGSYWKRGDLSTTEKEIRGRLSSFDFVEYMTGWIPTRFAEVVDRRFSFVHVDVDLYQPTLDSVRFFYDRLSPGGMLVCDDYGAIWCPGARQALDEFAAERNAPIACLSSGQALVIKR